MYNYMNYYSPQQASTNKIFVGGIEEVRQKMLMPNSDYFFLDNCKPIIYQKIVDNNGHYEIKQFKIEEIKEEVQEHEYVSMKEFEALKAEMEALKNEPIK